MHLRLRVVGIYFDKAKDFIFYIPDMHMLSSSSLVVSSVMILKRTCALAKTHLAARMNNFSGEFSSQTVVVLVAITDGMAITSTISSNLRWG